MSQSWIDKVLVACDDAETPRSWIKWSCLSSLAAVSSFNVWLDMHMYTIRPNIYCILIGPPGLGKGFPIDLAKDFVTIVDNTRIISGRNSVQSIIQQLGHSTTRQGGKPMFKGAQAFFGANEFATFCIEDPQALTILTDLWDYHKVWKNTTKGSGIDHLKNTSITMIGGAAPVHFKQVVPDNAIGGGFLARTLLINEEKAHKVNSLMRRDKRSKKLDKEELAQHLIEVSKLEGEIIPTEEAQIFWDDFYNSYKSKISDDKTGIKQRFHVHVLKTAILLSLSERLDKVLEKHHIEQAIELIQNIIHGAAKTLLGSGRNPLVHQTSLCIQYMLKHNLRASRQQLLRTYWGEFDAQDLDRIASSMMNADAWMMESEGKEIFYVMTETFAKAILEKENK